MRRSPKSIGCLDGTCTFFALDLDIDKAALEQAHGRPDLARSLRQTLRGEGLRLRGVLRELGFIPVLEDSGYKGRHLWVFLEQPESARVLHLFGRLLLSGEQPHLPPGLHLEFFPRQGSAGGKGLGNLRHGVGTVRNKNAVDLASRLRDAAHGVRRPAGVMGIFLESHDPAAMTGHFLLERRLHDRAIRIVRQKRSERALAA